MNVFKETNQKIKTLQSNKSKIFNELNKDFQMMGCTKITSLVIENGEKNQYFRNTCGIVHYTNKYFNSSNSGLSIKCESVKSIVEESMIIHPSIRIRLNHENYILFSPYGNDGIELGTILVSESGKGIGTYLMRVMFQILLLNNNNKLPSKIKLDCVGSLGSGLNRIESSISEQTRFFRKFGFRVNKDFKTKNGILKRVEMTFDETKIDGDFKTYIEKLKSTK
jgi:hypothetical protein